MTGAYISYIYPWIHADVRHRWPYRWHRDTHGDVIVTETVTGIGRPGRPARIYRWYGTHNRARIRQLTRHVTRRIMDDEVS